MDSSKLSGGYACLERELKHECSTGELSKLYDHWGKDYDKDTSEHGYVAFKKTASKVTELLREQNNSSTTIMDLGCGTGLVAEILHQNGFTNIDGLDISEVMLQVSKEKNIYRHLFCEVLGDQPLSVDEGSYDAVIAVGLFTFGHAKPSAFDEVLRITKQGGFIVFTIRGDITDDGFGYIPKIEELAKKGLWSVKEKLYIDYDLYYENPKRRNGFLYVCVKE